MRLTESNQGLPCRAGLSRLPIASLSGSGFVAIRPCGEDLATAVRQTMKRENHHGRKKAIKGQGEFTTRFGSSSLASIPWRDAYERIIEEGLRDKSEAARQTWEDLRDRWETVFHEPSKKEGPPPGFVKCPTCGEYNGTTLWENLTWLGPYHESGPGTMVSVRCRCRGPLCMHCHVNHVHASGSSSYDEETNSVGHWPGFAGMAPCWECVEKEKK